MPTPQTSSPDTRSSGEFSPFQATMQFSRLLEILRQRRRWLALGTSVGIGIAGILALLIPPLFEATVILLPPQQPQSLLASIAGQVGAVSLGMKDLGLKNPADLYVGILSSRTIADGVVLRFKLKDRYGMSTDVDTREKLASRTTIVAGNDTLIHITVEDRDPQTAADIANAYLDELNGNNTRLAITESAQRRLFFERQLDAERGAMAAAERDLAAMQKKTGLIELSGQMDASIQSIAQLRAEVASRQVLLRRLSTAITSEHPERLRLNEEIRELQSQIAGLQSSGPQAVGDPLPRTGNIPASGLEYFRAVRELKYHESLYEFLAKQYEAARIDEAKQAPVIQVVDRAVPADKRHWPPRLLMIVLGGVLGFLLPCASFGLRSPAAVELQEA